MVQVFDFGAELQKMSFWIRFYLWKKRKGFLRDYKLVLTPLPMFLFMEINQRPFASRFLNG